ncbi:MAG TPA: hypothetical protein PLX15_01935 [Candidatus Woesearchaeota archaeon]|nr:hypothetical protein [Candidatus Woesearchaeota archaeon]
MEQTHDISKHISEHISKYANNLFSDEIHHQTNSPTLDPNDISANLIYQDYISFLKNSIKNYIVITLLGRLNEIFGKTQIADDYLESKKEIQFPYFYTKGHNFMPDLEKISFAPSTLIPINPNDSNPENYSQILNTLKECLDYKNNPTSADQIFQLLNSFYVLIDNQKNEINSDSKETIDKTLHLFETHYAKLNGQNLDNGRV